MPRDRVRNVNDAGIISRWQRRTTALFRRSSFERNMAEEMHLHIANADLGAPSPWWRAICPRGALGAWIRRPR